jgi:hypothetical protein
LLLTRWSKKKRRLFRPPLLFDDLLKLSPR